MQANLDGSASLQCIRLYEALTPSFRAPRQIDTGYRLEVVTLRKLEFENDAFAFGDKLIEKWYPTVEQGNDKGLLLIVTTAKDGALTGGPNFTKVWPTMSANRYLQLKCVLGSNEHVPKIPTLPSEALDETTDQASK